MGDDARDAASPGRDGREQVPLEELGEEIVQLAEELRTMERDREALEAEYDRLRRARAEKDGPSGDGRDREEGRGRKVRDREEGRDRDDRFT